MPVLSFESSDDFEIIVLGVNYGLSFYCFKSEIEEYGVKLIFIGLSSCLGDTIREGKLESARLQGGEF